MREVPKRGHPPPQARAQGARVGGEWGRVEVQCQTCGWYLCAYCAHTELRECRGKCLEEAQAPCTYRKKLEADALATRWGWVTWWRSGAAMREAEEATLAADRVALHAMEASQAVQTLRNF